MTSIDYNVFYKTELPLNAPWASESWDVFVSAYNSSERVRIVFDKAADAIGTNKTFDIDRFFAPANDPFITAATLSEIVRLRERHGPITNLYLSPLATKPQALGFALYYLAECVGKNASILFPISTRYERETSTGLSRVWKYTVQYPLL